MMNLRTFFQLTFIFFIAGSLNAQQSIMFSQYYNNKVIYNPAVSGSELYNPLILQTRQQWLGFEGAPLSANISYHGSLNNRSALGGYFEHDRTSPANQTNLQLNYAYHVPLDYEDIYVSFGIGAKITYYYLDFLPEDLPPGRDPAFSSNAYDNVLGDASSGVYFYGKNFHAGYSILNMLESTFNPEAGDGFSTNSQERVHYGIAAYRFKLDRDWHLEPSILIRKFEVFNPEYNISSRLFYMDQIWSGLSLRSNSSLSFAVGTKYQNMFFSYSFDHYFGEISKYQLGTHEVTISVRIPTLANSNHTLFWGY